GERCDRPRRCGEIRNSRNTDGCAHRSPVNALPCLRLAAVRSRARALAQGKTPKTRRSSLVPRRAGDLARNDIEPQLPALGDVYPYFTLYEVPIKRSRFPPPRARLRFHD